MNFLTDKAIPITVHKRSINKLRPYSHDPAASLAMNESGRKTDRIACVSHFNGKIAANPCIHSGSWVKMKKTPLKNCRMITIGDTTADAPLPLFGIALKAIPSAVAQIVPITKKRKKLIHLAVVVGICNPKKATPAPIKRRTCTAILKRSKIALPMKYEAGDIGVPRKRLRVQIGRAHV